MSLGQHVFFLLLFLFAPLGSIAQSADSLVVGLSDSLLIEEVEEEVTKEKKPHSPKLATLLSAVAPGAGQIYNRKYWKLPIIYGAFGGLIYSAVWNHTKFRTFKDAYLIRIDGDPTTIDQFEGQFSDDNLRTIQADYRRNRDLSYVFIGVFYALNIIDAAVDGHLFDFNVDEDLSLQIKPVIEPIDYQQAQVYGLGLTLRLR
ncbi:MAG: hypothetical protein ACI85F_002855 [Bacteroidia bacterium]|jgi:hypothetical protein